MPTISHLFWVFFITTNCKKYFRRQTPRTTLPRSMVFLKMKPFKLIMASNVRWGTTHQMIYRIILAQPALLHTLKDQCVQSLRNLQNDALEWISFLEENFYIMFELEQLLRPLAIGIKKLEGDNVPGLPAYFSMLNSLEQVIVRASLSSALDEDLIDDIKKVRY